MQSEYLETRSNTSQHCAGANLVDRLRQIYGFCVNVHKIKFMHKWHTHHTVLAFLHWHDPHAISTPPRAHTHHLSPSSLKKNNNEIPTDMKLSFSQWLWHNAKQSLPHIVKRQRSLRTTIWKTTDHHENEDKKIAYFSVLTFLNVLVSCWIQTSLEWGDWDKVFIEKVN